MVSRGRGGMISARRASARPRRTISGIAISASTGTRVSIGSATRDISGILSSMTGRSGRAASARDARARASARRRTPGKRRASRRRLAATRGTLSDTRGSLMDGNMSFTNLRGRCVGGNKLDRRSCRALRGTKCPGTIISKVLTN